MCSIEAEASTRGIGRPHILAYLNTNPHSARTEKDITTYGHGMLSYPYGLVLKDITGGEPTLLLELPIVGEIGLGYGPQDMTLLEDYGTIEKLFFHSHRHSHNYERTGIGRVSYQLAKGCISLV